MGRRSKISTWLFCFCRKVGPDISALCVRVQANVEPIWGTSRRHLSFAFGVHDIRTVAAQTSLRFLMFLGLSVSVHRLQFSDEPAPAATFPVYLSSLERRPGLLHRDLVFPLRPHIYDLPADHHSGDTEGGMCSCMCVCSDWQLFGEKRALLLSSVQRR